MIKFERLGIYNWLNAIYGMRNSWESWTLMDSYEEFVKEFGEMDSTEVPTGRTIIGPNDYKLMMKLANAGDDHAKFMRQIFVSVDIIAPEYWWREYVTYKVGTSENSTSQMHMLGKRLLTVDDFTFDEPDDPFNIETVERVNQLVKAWWDTGKKIRSPEWRKMLQNVPQSYNYRRTCASNYQVLKRMYHARKEHRLQEWRDFCRWVESLPCSDIITLNNRMYKLNFFIDGMKGFMNMDNINHKTVIVIDRNYDWWYRVILNGATPKQADALEKATYLRFEECKNVEVVTDDATM